jgi:glycosyltransferase involved in cell wall biosynthesis
VSISHAYADNLDEIYGPLINVSVIYNGGDAAEFYSLNKKKQAFAMGRVWDEAKNLSILGKLDNAAQISTYLAGNNQHPSTSLRVEIPNVQVLGTLSRPEVKRYLAQSLIYIHPAKYEPFGLSVLEAALSGCLLVLADIPTLKEFWQDTARYFNPEKPEELDNQLKHALQNPEMCDLLVSQSSSRAKFFSLEVMANNYLDLYHSILVKPAMFSYLNSHI